MKKMWFLVIPFLLVVCISCNRSDEKEDPCHYVITADGVQSPRWLAQKVDSINREFQPSVIREPWVFAIKYNNEEHIAIWDIFKEIIPEGLLFYEYCSGEAIHPNSGKYRTLDSVFRWHTRSSNDDGVWYVNTTLLWKRPGETDHWLFYEKPGMEGVYGWRYPLAPGMEEWAIFRTGVEKYRVRQIPVVFLKSMSTKEIVYTCLNYPNFTEFLYFDNIKQAMDLMSNRFDGFIELATRKDNAECLLMVLRSCNYFDNFVMRDDEIYPGSLSYLYMFVETLSSMEWVLVNANSEQIREMASISMNNLTVKMKLPEIIGLLGITTSAYLLCASLKIMNNNSDLSKELESFLGYGGPITHVQWDQLMQLYVETFNQNNQ